MEENDEYFYEDIESILGKLCINYDKSLNFQYQVDKYIDAIWDVVIKLLKTKQEKLK